MVLISVLLTQGCLLPSVQGLNSTRARDQKHTTREHHTPSNLSIQREWETWQSSNDTSEPWAPRQYLLLISLLSWHRKMNNFTTIDKAIQSSVLSPALISLHFPLQAFIAEAGRNDNGCSFSFASYRWGSAAVRGGRLLFPPGNFIFLGPGPPKSEVD